MPSTRFWPAIAALLLLAPAILGRGGEPPPPADPPAGELLVASAAIQDPRFQHAVVLLLRHDGTGAFGIVINHPLAERPLAALLADTCSNDNTDSAVEGTIRVFLGGPVQPEYGFVIHSTDYHRPETLVVGDELAMTASTAVLRDIGHHRGPAKFLFALGYAGWGAGQLEGEIANHGWFTAPATPDLVFDADRETVWEKALARRSREL
jgi:putative transcriptional regulator